MSMYFIGIDISKYKHDCCIISAADQKVVSKVTIKNNKSGFNELLTTSLFTTFCTVPLKITLLYMALYHTFYYL